MNQKGVTSLFSGIAILFVSIIFLGIFIYFAMNYFGTLEDSQRMKNNRDNLAYINDILTDLKDSEVGSYKEVYLDLSDPITVDNNSSNLYLRQEIKNKRSIENLKTQSQIGSLIINRQETSLLYNIDYNNNILFYNYIDIMPGLEELRFSVVDKNNNIPIIEIQRIGDEILIEEVVNQSIVLSNNNINQDLVLTSYFIASDAVDTEYLNKNIFFEEPITIEKKETKEIDVVCAPEENYILKLNTDKGREIVKPIKTNNYNVLDCIDYQIIGYWKIDEGEGSTVYDYSGNSNNGSIVGTANWNSSSKLNLDGANDYINVSNVGDYSSFTINGWIYYTENQSLEHESFFWSQKNNLRVSINPVDKKMEIRWRDLDGGYSTYELSDPVEENKWINYTVTYDETLKTLKGYINGNLEKTLEEIYSYETQGGGVKFGINSTNTRYFKGMISDYRLYGRSLNLNEIKAIYDNTKNEYVEELTININSPTNLQTFSFGEAIDFNSQIENENGSYSCSWVSSIDGSLSSNCDFSTSSLTVGEHTITLSVTDQEQTIDKNISITIIDLDGSSSEKAAPSAMYIKNNNPSATNGVYWILKDGVPTQIYCNMEDNGGGWMLYSSFSTDNTYDSSYPAWNGNRILTTDLSTYGYNLDYYTHYNDGVNVNFASYTRRPEFLSFFYSGPADNGLLTMNTWNGPSDINQLRVYYGLGSTAASYSSNSGNLIINNSTVVTGTSGDFTSVSISSFDPDGTIPLLRVEEIGIVGISWIFMRSIPNPISVTIDTPSNSSTHNYGENLTFNSTITNPSGSHSCYWDSNIDGTLSSTCNFSTTNLSSGEHKITLIVNDQYQTAGASINLTINQGYLEATGGTVTTSGDYKYHTFTSSGTFNVTTLGEGKVDVLVVGGGGGAGKAGTNTLRNPGGGGAGGLVYVEDYTLSSTGNITVTVGAGGTGSTNQDFTGNNGNNSVFKNLIAYGGGGGGSRDNPSRDGTSGGSGGGANLYSAVPANGGSATQPSTNDGYPNTGFGYPGATSVVNVGAGGGGGAGGPGTVPNGGPGMTIWGNTYAKGGDAHSDASSAAANTGNGGNGSATNSSANGGNGGSGIVIVRYKYQN